MSETIQLMKSHTSVRRFNEEAIPQEGKISNPIL